MKLFTRKVLTIKYAKLIEEMVAKVRRHLTSSEQACEDMSIKRFTEFIVLDSDEINLINVSDISEFMNAVIRRTTSKYGILGELLDNPDINEIMINGPEHIFVEINRHIEEIDDAFVSETELEDIMRMLASDVHREINDANPIVDARLPNGYRVNGVLKTVALNGPILTIRKFSDEVITPNDLIDYGSLPECCMAELLNYVRCGYNIFVSGGTSSGKTTFLNALSMGIGQNERIIVIEDSAELKLDSLSNIVHMECRNSNSSGRGEITMQDLIKTSLRMRPDRIIVGEVRGKEVVDMIQAMNTGHAGSMSTGHGNSIRGMLNRLETMYLMDAGIPIHSVKSQIANAIDIFVHLRRLKDGRRVVTEVAELSGFDGEDYQLNYLYVVDQDGFLIPTGNELIDRERLGSDEDYFV